MCLTALDPNLYLSPSLFDYISGIRVADRNTYSLATRYLEDYLDYVVETMHFLDTFGVQTKYRKDTHTYFFGSLGIAPTPNCTHFLKIGLVVARDGFYSYYIHQGNKSDKEKENARKKSSFMQ